MRKRGLSKLIEDLLIILLSLMIIGVIWFMASKFISEKGEETGLEKFTINLKIVSVNSVGSNIHILVKRNPGAGVLTGIYFVISEGRNSESVIKNTTMKELESETFVILQDELNIPLENITEISIAPIFKLDSGKEEIGNIVDTYYIQKDSFANQIEDGEDSGYCDWDCVIPENIIWKPFPMRNEWQKQKGLNGGEGMQMVIGIDWNKNNTNILYMTVNTLRVWKSIDRGESWFPLAQDLLVKGGDSIVSDPNNADVVFFVGLSGNINQIAFDGIYKSLDGGITWDLVRQAYFKPLKIGQLFLIDPDSYNGVYSQTIYAGTPEGVLISSNGGDMWQDFSLKNEYVYDLEWSDANRSFFYASTNVSLYKVYVKDGSTEKLNIPVPPWDVSVSPKDEKIIHTASKDGSYKSINGGVSFVKKSIGLPTGKEYKRIASSRIDPNILIISVDQYGFQKRAPFWSNDSGETWNFIEDDHPEEELTPGNFFSKPLAFDPENSLIAITAASGSNKKTFDGGKTWHYSSEGFTGARVREINFISETEMLFCLTDFGIYLTEDSGESFRDLNLIRAYGARSCGSSDISSDRIISSSGGWGNQDILLSKDKGISWKNVKIANRSFNFIKFNPDNENIVYANTYISHDKGDTWSLVNDNYNVKAINPHNGNTIYGHKNISNIKWQIGVSYDLGENWEPLGSSVTTLPQEMAVDPHSSDLHILAAAGSSGILEYKDNSWKTLGIGPIGPGKPYSSQGINYIEFDPINPGIVWAAGYGYGKHSEGIYFSNNSGENWTNVVNNLGPYQDIWNIDISPYDNRVYITGPGVWTYKP